MSSTTTTSKTLTPRLGAIVIYRLSEMDAREIRQRRLARGSANAPGNDALEGMCFPAMIVRDWAAGYPAEHGGPARSAEAGATVNLQVFLDGGDTYWTTSRARFDPAVHGMTPDDQDDQYDRESVSASGLEIPPGAGNGLARGFWTDAPIAW